jgi:hypothetical protein
VGAPTEPLELDAAHAAERDELLNPALDAVGRLLAFGRERRLLGPAEPVVVRVVGDRQNGGARARAAPHHRSLTRPGRPCHGLEAHGDATRGGSTSIACVMCHLPSARGTASRRMNGTTTSHHSRSATQPLPLLMQLMSKMPISPPLCAAPTQCALDAHEAVQRKIKVCRRARRQYRLPDCADAVECVEHHRRVDVASAFEITDVRAHVVERDAHDGCERAGTAVAAPCVGGALGIGEVKARGVDHARPSPAI